MSQKCPKDCPLLKCHRLQITVLNRLHQLNNDILHFAIPDRFVNERNLATDCSLLDTRAKRKAVQVLRTVHADAKLEPHKLVYRARSAEILARRRKPTPTLEVLHAQVMESRRRALGELRTERGYVRDLRRKTVFSGEEINKRRRCRSCDRLHAPPAVGGTRRIECTENGTFDCGQELAQVGLRSGEVLREKVTNKRRERRPKVLVHRPEIQGLAENEKIARSEERKHFKSSDRVAGRDKCKRAKRSLIICDALYQCSNSLYCLVVHLSRLHMCGDRVGQVTELANVCSSVNINTLRKVVVRWLGRSKIRRQTTIHGRVDQLSALREEQLANMVDRQTGLLHRIGHSHSLEVTTVVHLASLSVNERVIGCCAHPVNTSMTT
jgi:hypothetical protein